MNLYVKMFFGGFIYLDVSAHGQLDLWFQMCYRTIRWEYFVNQENSFYSQYTELQT